MIALREEVDKALELVDREGEARKERTGRTALWAPDMAQIILAAEVRRLRAALEIESNALVLANDSLGRLRFERDELREQLGRERGALKPVLRSQIEDLEGEIAILKEQLSRKELERWNWEQSYTHIKRDVRELLEALPKRAWTEHVTGALQRLKARVS
ncbi:MAG TPA: hypothetical protein VJ764_00800 [Steroidobacteraceae bacterium]|nr:hypothetical protein [Steroidobacteraceae bacterium]